MRRPRIKIAPSILNADILDLRRAVKSVERGGADLIHVDVMDGHFVPNLSMGAGVVRSLRRATRIPIDVHLMVTDPAKHVDEFLKAGAGNITFHVEAKGDERGLLRRIKRRGARASLSLKPLTPVGRLRGLLRMVDMVLLMTVEPGWGGQPFMRSMLSKIRALRRMADDMHLPLDIEVDGGLTANTVQSAVSAGANVIVSGAAIFKSRDPGLAVKRLRQIATGAVPCVGGP